MVANALTSNTVQTIAQNTDACVKIETGLKAVGRPAFTLIDKNTDKETRKYAASKELLYQLLCFGIYLAIIPPVFKEGVQIAVMKVNIERAVKSAPAFDLRHSGCFGFKKVIGSFAQTEIF